MSIVNGNELKLMKETSCEFDSYRLPIVIDDVWFIDCYRLVSEIIFVLLQVTLTQCLTKFDYNGFIES